MGITDHCSQMAGDGKPIIQTRLEGCWRVCSCMVSFMDSRRLNSYVISFLAEPGVIVVMMDACG